MKLSVFFLFFIATGLYAIETHSQETRVNLNASDVSVKEVLGEIEKQTDYLFIYNPLEVNLNDKTSVRAKNKSVKDILATLFNQSDIVYAIEGSNIMLMKRQEVQQDDRKRIKGIVVDDYGEPIIGANILEKNTANGVITDYEGNFSMLISDNAVLQISYIGYLTQDVAVKNQTEIKITLKEDQQTLAEVVVVGFGTQKKMNLTGAVSSTDSKVFENRPITSAATALQGVVAGLNINPSNGNPNDDLTINIRGTTSVNGGDPLVLVDGIETSLKLVNPNDIESISVLKDAAASAIYGVRAAFGVVLITTKKGATDSKLTVNYSNNFGWAKATVMPEFVDNSLDHVKFVNQALKNNNGAAPLYSEIHVAAIEAKLKNPSLPDYIFEGNQYRSVGYTNWKKELIQDYSPRQTHSVNISGGSEKTSFYASASYLNQEGVIKINPDIYERLNTSLSIENQSYSWMKLGFRMRYNTSKMDEPYHYNGNSFWHMLLFSSPLQGGQWLGDPAYPQYDDLIGRYFQDQNQIPLLKYGGRTIKQQHEIVLTPSIDIMPIKGLRIHLDYNFSKTFSYDTYDKKRMVDYFVHGTPTGLTPHNGPGGATDSYSKRNSQRSYSSFNAYADYEFALKEKHHFKAMLGFNQELTKYNYYTAERQMMVNPELPGLSLGSGDHVVSETAYEWALRGGFGRLNYDYDNRYLVELVGRYDGTSRFPKDNRFVFLPSFSVGWRLSEESFMSFVKPLFDSIKLRGSYGTLGNQMITASAWKGNTRYYPYIPFLTNGTSTHYLFGNVGTELTVNPPLALTPAGLTWEKVNTVNAAIDVVMLDQRLNFSFDMFKRTTDDMLLQQTYPDILGTGAPVINGGKLETKGWDLSVNWRDRIGKDWQYSIGVTLHDSQAKITKWSGGAGTVDNFYAGKKVGEIWGYVTEGFLNETDFIDGDPKKGLIIPQSSIASSWAPGDIKYADLDKSGAVDLGDNTPGKPGDRRVIGNTTPRYQYSITGDVSWKGLFVNFFFQGVGKRDVWPAAQDFWPAATQYYNTQKRFLTDCWTPENTNAYYALPRARGTQNSQQQTKYLQDGSYIRLKNLTVGYELPKNWVEKVYLRRVQVYVSGENLWEKSNLVGPYDPEGIFNSIDGLGVAAYGYPMQRVYSIGLNVTF